MKQRPIPFTAPMVRALLDGTKTQTRRVVKPVAMLGGWEISHNARGDETSRWPLGRGLNPSPCPHGQPGDRLWVREAWAVHPILDSRAPRDIDAVFTYFADSPPSSMLIGKTRPSIHMPRWASRILLEVTAVRVERLQDISEADAIAEGIDASASSATLSTIGTRDIAGPVAEYSVLWEQINGPDSWSQNPWVWVIEFKRVQP